MKRAAMMCSLMLMSAAAMAQPYYVFPCAQPPDPDYTKCLKESKTRADRNGCAQLLQQDLREIDDWHRCRLAEVDADAVKKKEAINDLAAQRREQLMRRLSANSTP